MEDLEKKLLEAVATVLLQMKTAKLAECQKYPINNNEVLAVIQLTIEAEIRSLVDLLKSLEGK